MASAAVGVIGGSGFYSLLEDAERVQVSTPYGDPSGEITVGTLAGVSVAFLPRHGHDHRFPPHRVPYRANLWALRSLGVRQVISLSAVGSLRPELGPGTLVVPDQLVDRTWGRDYTYFDGIGSSCTSRWPTRTARAGAPRRWRRTWSTAGRWW